MATLNDAIYSQQQPLDILGNVQKGMNMAQAMQQQKIAAQKYQENQALEQAAKSSLVQGPNGQLTFDQGKFQQAVASNPNVNALQAMQLGQQQRTQGFQNAQNEYKTHLQNLDLMTRSLPGVHDQQSLDNFLQKGAKNGWDVSDFGTTWSPQVAQQIKDHIKMGESIKDQITQGIEQQKANAAAAAAGGAAAKNYETTLNQLGQHILTSRQTKALQLASQDGYQALKGKITVASAMGKPNSMQSELVASDLGKIAQGGSPTEAELKALNPATLSGLKAKLQEYMTSHPTDTGNAALMNVANQYFTDIVNNSRNLIRSSNLKAINLYANHLSPKDKATAIAQYVTADPFAQDSPYNQSVTNFAGQQTNNSGPSLQDLLAEKARREKAKMAGQ